MKDPRDWLLDFLSSRSGAERYCREELARVDFFGSGILDSMGVVELVEGIERELGVRLEQKHLDDPRFVTVSGLVDILREIPALRQ